MAFLEVMSYTMLWAAFEQINTPFLNNRMAQYVLVVQHLVQDVIEESRVKGGPLAYLDALSKR